MNICPVHCDMFTRGGNERTLSRVGFPSKHLCLCVFPIVVHLAVLCSTLCSQHAGHLKPDTYGPVCCWSETPLPSLEPLLMLRTFHLVHSDALFIKKNIYVKKPLLIGYPVYDCEPLLFAPSASDTQCFLLREYIDVGKAWCCWFNLPYPSLSVANWLNCINREACSVGQRGAGMRDMEGMREDSSWCEGVRPHNGGEIWFGDD